MKIFKIEIENFRLLKKFSIDIEKELSLVIGKNNTGKTSMLTVLDKFLNEKSKFSYDDFNIEFKKELETLLSSELPDKFLAKGIKLKIFIAYDEIDDLSNVSKLLMDLDPNNNKIVLGFEYVIDFDSFKKLKEDSYLFIKNEDLKEKKNEKYKKKELRDFLKRDIEKYFKICRMSFEYDKATDTVTESNYINLEKEGISIKDIISFKYISARRDVSNKEKENTLSKQTSSLYKKKEDSSEGNQVSEGFKDQLSETDGILSDIYKNLFQDVIKKVKDFGGIRINDTELSIISTLQHRELLEGNTTVVYTHDDHKLPENYNGLGYMNLLCMIFEIEILVQEFKRDENRNPADINLLFIEEPEAHTHPQMQYIFIKNIKKLLKEGVKRKDNTHCPLQYIITTHSSHIVADSDFDDIKYLKLEKKNNVIARNLKDLRNLYDKNPNQYQFLKQYLTINRAEVFFADKAILIEGDTERILMPTFMKKIDIEREEEEDKGIRLLSQNISIIEVGAYSQIFRKFIEFLGIKTLIITDIDSTKEGKSCTVEEGDNTSNAAIKEFLDNFSWNDIKCSSVDKRTIEIGGGAVICICYQQKDNKYHARSFEDAFIHLNRDFIKGKKDEFKGLKNRKNFDSNENDAYKLATECIKKKTHFALDILFCSDKDFNDWKIPAYIKEGLLWLMKD